MKEGAINRVCRGLPAHDQDRRTFPSQAKLRSPFHRRLSRRSMRLSCHGDFTRVWQCGRTDLIPRLASPSQRPGAGEDVVNNRFRLASVGVQLGRSYAPLLQPHAWGFPVAWRRCQAGFADGNRTGKSCHCAPLCRAPEDTLEDRPIREGFRATARRGLALRERGTP